jgi:hypothetical protein
MSTSAPQLLKCSISGGRDCPRRCRPSSVLLRHAVEGGMLPVTLCQYSHADAVGAPTVLGDNTLEPHAAGDLEQRRSDLALLEGSHAEAVRPATQQLRQVLLA